MTTNHVRRPYLTYTELTTFIIASVCNSLILQSRATDSDHTRIADGWLQPRPPAHQQVLQRHRLQLPQRRQLRRHEVLQVTKVTCANVFRGGIINQC